MSGYLDSFKFKYTTPNTEFAKEIKRYLAKLWDEKTPGVLNCDTEANNLLIKIETGAYIGKREFWTVRKRIAEYRDRKRAEWACDPNTETYKCS